MCVLSRAGFERIITIGPHASLNELDICGLIIETSAFGWSSKPSAVSRVVTDSDLMSESGRKTFQNCPILGIGLSLPIALLSDVLASVDAIQWLEVISETYMDEGGASLQSLVQAKSLYPIVCHGVAMSLGSVDPISEGYLQKLEVLFELCRPPWFSDHLCFSSFGGRYFHDLIPLPRTSETIHHVADRIKRIQDRFQRPFLIENLSQHLQCPMDMMTEAEFYSRIVEEADCGLLLDVNNIYVNSLNQRSEPMDFLTNIPLERVVEIHVAGHSPSAHFPGVTIDTHGAPVCESVLDLLEWTLARTNPCGVLLERDNNIPPFQELLDELGEIRKRWIKAGLNGAYI